MQNDQSDLELIFKKRARRRLVGAIALALLMIIVLPILLKDRTKMSPQQEIAITMPNVTSEKALNNSASAEIDGVASYEEVIELPNPEVATVTPLPEPTIKSEKKAVTSKPTEAPKVVANVESKPKVTIKPTEKDSIAKESVKSTDNQFYVQIGVFSDVNNVKKLQVKLNELGYRPVTEKITTETGEKTRLRTTNFTGKNEATIALQNIKDAGLTGMVVSQK